VFKALGQAEQLSLAQIATQAGITPILLDDCYQTDSDATGFNLVEPGGIPKE
jgi:hypothetical protein